jgi:hypothetical protein
VEAAYRVYYCNFSEYSDFVGTSCGAGKGANAANCTIYQSIAPLHSGSVSGPIVGYASFVDVWQYNDAVLTAERVLATTNAVFQFSQTEDWLGLTSLAYFAAYESPIWRDGYTFQVQAYQFVSPNGSVASAPSAPGQIGGRQRVDVSFLLRGSVYEWNVTSSIL